MLIVNVFCTAQCDAHQTLLHTPDGLELL